MLQEAFDRQQKGRFHLFIWLAASLLIIAVLMVEWQKITEKAEQIQLRVLVQTFNKSASSLRQQWELQDKPQQSELSDIQYGFTRFGWPIVLDGEEVDCKKTWDLLVSRVNGVAYIRLGSKNGMLSARYNSCYYQITDGHWLELFYENETIHINGFLTD